MATAVLISHMSFEPSSSPAPGGEFISEDTPLTDPSVVSRQIEENDNSDFIPKPIDVSRFKLYAGFNLAMNDGKGLANDTPDTLQNMVSL